MPLFTKPPPLITTTGAPVALLKSGSLLASITRAWVMAGSAAVRSMRCSPPTKASLMENRILSGAVPLAVLLAAAMASRKLMRPSAPLFNSKALRLLVSPSAVSLAVVTTMVLWVSLSMLLKLTSTGFSPL